MEVKIGFKYTYVNDNVDWKIQKQVSRLIRKIKTTCIKWFFYVQ